jgi:hydrogenase-4 membrane subunit HyfE
MILLAYGAAAVISVLAVTAVPCRLRHRPALITSARVLAATLSAIYASVIVTVVLFASAGDGLTLAWGLAGMAVAGLVLFVAGLVRWSGRAALLLRLIGWLLLIVPALVPSHLTLLLPLAAPLAAVLYRAQPATRVPTAVSDGAAA